MSKRIEPEVPQEGNRRTAARHPEGAAGGRPHLPQVARLGGRAVVEKYGPEHMARIGKQGSRAVVKKYGLRFYSEIAARNRGVSKRRKERSPSA